jgi:hypothetical protein
MALFTGDPEIIRLSTWYLRIVGPIYGLYDIGMALYFATQGFGSVMWTVGIGGVVGGVLHAVQIPEHGLSLLALGLVLGRQQQATRRVGLLVSTVALICGLVAAALTGEETPAGDALVLAAGLLGLLVAAAWMPPFLGLPLAAIAGLTIALDSRPDGTTTAEAIRMPIAGSGVGATVAPILVAKGRFSCGVIPNSSWRASPDLGSLPSRSWCSRFGSSRASPPGEGATRDP